MTDEEIKELKERAFKLLLSNKKEGFSKHLGKPYFYFAPDEVHYHQWFWDSCFHSIVMTEHKVELAIKEMEMATPRHLSVFQSVAQRDPSAISFFHCRNTTTSYWYYIEEDLREDKVHWIFEKVSTACATLF